MRSHFLPGTPNTEQKAASATKGTMRSHFVMNSAAMACALSAATAMMTGVCSGQIAADFATDPTYAGGWSAGQNGGFGFGAWSFNGTVAPSTGTPDPGAQQTMSSSSPVGRAWTLFNLGSAPSSSGLSDSGRAITEAGGLQPGQTFETVIDNPTAYHFFGGFDILFNNGTDNNGAGVNTAAIRVSVFNYGGNNWNLDDTGSTSTPLSSTTTGVAGMKLDLTLTSATTYSVTLTPLNGATAYTHAGTLGTSVPINYVNFRLYDGASGGPNDTANNFEISSMTISVPEPSSMALIGLGYAGLLFLRRRK